MGSFQYNDGNKNYFFVFLLMSMAVKQNNEEKIRMVYATQEHRWSKDDKKYNKMLWEEDAKAGVCHQLYYPKLRRVSNERVIFFLLSFRTLCVFMIRTNVCNVNVIHL